MCVFEEKVLRSFNQLSIEINESLSLGAAVSGGADSISLLISLANLIPENGKSLEVITVNHNIRPAEESCGDADFVVSICNHLKELGKNVNCTVITIPEGKVTECAQKRKCGVEEAARFLRYSAFDDFILQKKLDFLCLAHNKNDQLETLLMRFLQGSSVDSSSGIAAKREKYIRPLLEIQRKEIEIYLNDNQISWRTDKTNFETDYLRNKIRLKLVPLLNEQFDGWQTALLNGAVKAAMDKELIRKEIEKFNFVTNETGVEINCEDFLSLEEGIQYRLLLKAANIVSNESRIPFSFIIEFLEELKSGKKNVEKRFRNLLFGFKNNRIFVNKYAKTQTDLVFFDIIEETGVYSFPFGELHVFDSVLIGNQICVSIGINNEQVLTKMTLPFIVRNTRIDDEILTANGGLKKLSDIFDDWKVSEHHRLLIPVFQELSEEKQMLKVMAGSFLGYKDWIVRK